jgi:hypothetical protein
LEALKGKMVILEDSGGIYGILEWLEDFGAKEPGSCEIWGFFEDFFEIFMVYCGLGPSRN